VGLKGMLRMGLQLELIASVNVHRHASLDRSMTCRDTEGISTYDVSDFTRRTLC
jgi:hypothetical protein